MRLNFLTCHACSAMAIRKAIVSATGIEYQNAIDGIVEQVRKQEEQRHEEEQLAREREEDAFARLPYTLEKSSCDYLNAYQWKCESHNAQAVGGLLNQLRRTFCKERHERRSEEEVNTKEMKVMTVANKPAFFSTSIKRS